MAEKQVTEARVKELIAGGIGSLLVDVETRFDKKIAETIAFLVTKEEVAGDLQKILKNLKNFVPAEVLENRLSDLITKDQWNEALEGMLSTAVPLSGIRPDLALAEMSADPVPPEYLSGLSFRQSVRKVVEEDGQSKAAFSVEVRPLEPGDVLNFRETATEMIIVTADGQKHTVDKKRRKG
jgi:hypothetical protein